MSNILYTLTTALNGVFSVGFLVSFLFTLTIIKYDELGSFNKDVLCQNETICIFDTSAAYAYVEAAIALFSIILFSIKFCISKKMFAIHGWFHVIFAVGFVVFLVMRLIHFGYFDFAWKDQGCKNPEIDGNPFERLLRYGVEPDNEIKIKEQCTFNAFNQENIIYSVSQVNYKIDWSSKDTYMNDQRQNLLQNANGVLPNASKFSIDDLPYYYHTYYWGCSSICLPERYEMNMLWIWMTLGACLAEVLLAVLSFWLAQKYIEVEVGTVEEQKKLITQQLSNGSVSSSSRLKL